jgi:hypothetical protein
MRHNRTEPEQETMKSRPDSWNPDLAEPQFEGDDGPQQRGRIARAASESGSSWQDIKSRFVDDPKGAIEAAEQLVQQAVDERVRAMQAEASAICAREREEDDGDEASTEGMRTRLIRYQQYCERLSDSSLR